jgi:hypothetical protein
VLGGGAGRGDGERELGPGLDAGLDLGRADGEWAGLAGGGLACGEVLRRSRSLSVTLPAGAVTLIARPRRRAVRVALVVATLIVGGIGEPGGGDGLPGSIAGGGGVGPVRGA